MTQRTNGNGGQRPPQKWGDKRPQGQNQNRFEKRPSRPTGEGRFEKNAPHPMGKERNENRPARPLGDRSPAGGAPRFGERKQPAHQSFGFGRVEQDAARLLAFNVLEDVSRADAFASLALSQRLRGSTLSQRDRALASELVYGTLERRITLDYLLNQRLRNPDIDPALRDLLRMGAYQILYLDRVPDSAAVDETVKICKAVGKEAFAALVNAVLRTLSREKENLEFPAQENLAQYLSVTESMPQWLCEHLIQAYGPETAREIVSYRPREKGVTIRRTPEKSTAEEFETHLTERGLTWERGAVPDSYRVEGLGDVGIEKDYLRGLYSAQGESSMMAAMAVSPKRGESVLDACAAPGGKTACLSSMLQGTGRVYAWDVHDHRVELIRGLIRRLGLDNVRPAVRDASVLKEDMAGSMDAVLLDAPCSGLGVMLSKPDVKYRQTPEGVRSLAETQKALLDACSQYVRPGGTLVYSTCTILPEENEKQVEAFLARHPEFEGDGERLKKLLPQPFAQHIQGCSLQLLAHRDGTDGFFIARMRRKNV